MEDMPTRGDFANLDSIRESLHADHTLRCVEFVHIFVILLELDVWNKSCILVDQRSMHLACHLFSILSPITPSLSLLI